MNLKFLLVADIALHIFQISINNFLLIEHDFGETVGNSFTKHEFVVKAAD